MGSVSDLQVDQARRLIEAAEQRFEYHSFPETGHFMHAENPGLYVATLLPWTKTLNPPAYGMVVRQSRKAGQLE